MRMELSDLYSLISNEHELLGFLQFSGLLISEKKCIKCKRQCLIYKRKDYYFFKCNKSKCRRVYSAIEKNSFLSHAHLNVKVVLQIIFCFLSDMTATQIKTLLGVSNNTVTDWLNFCREVCEVSIMGSTTKIGGEGKVVEIDELDFGKRKCNRGKIVESRWVIGGIERGSDKCFLVPVINRDSETFRKVIETYVEAGTAIIINELKGYKMLCEQNFNHLTINNSIYFTNSETGTHTTTIEGEWSKIKRSLPKTGIKDELFHSYLCSYIWKKSNKDNLFQNFISEITKHDSLGRQNARRKTYKLNFVDVSANELDLPKNSEHTENEDPLSGNQEELSSVDIKSEVSFTDEFLSEVKEESNHEPSVHSFSPIEVLDG